MLESVSSAYSRSARTAVLLVLLETLGSVHLRGQDFRIGIIDFYGLRRVSVDAVRRALTFKQGDAISLKNGSNRPAFLAESERNISAIPGVAHARMSVICCDSGNIIIYVGIEETGRSSTSFRSSPSGPARLPRDVNDAAAAFEKAFTAAVQRGDVAEDDDQGHALFHDPASRAIQERFIKYAERDLPLLRQVLRDSRDADQRALAAQVLGYVRDKQSVVGDLVDAMTDPAEDVRNNAMRTLLVFTRMTPGPAPRVPSQPFVRMLNSPVWTDRNKASGALDELSRTRSPALLGTLRQASLESLVEMARWKSKGHAAAAFFILGRIAGLPEPALVAAWDRDDRKDVIDAALKMQ
jgi:hypothetical protein